MNYKKIKNEIRLFFNWKQTKIEIAAFLATSTDILKKCEVSESIINKFNEKRDFNEKLTAKLIPKLIIVFLFIAILMYINDYILV